jgi:beta-exotoxin I transport system permease protein
MSATIYKHEFRSRLRSVLIWSLSVAAMVLFFFSIFPAFADEAALMNQLLAKFPPQLLEAFGMNRMDLSSVAGFYSFLFVFVQLCLAIQAGNYGFGLVSVEESEMTADFLLTKPVSRLQVLTSKLLAVLSSLVLTDLVIWVASFVAILAWHGNREYDAGLLAKLMLSIIVFQLFFLALGLVISLLVKRVRSVTPYSLGLGFGAYVLAAFSGIFGDVKLEYITPFKQLDPAYFVKQGAYETPLLLLNVAISVVALSASYWLYIRRDIPAVS